MEETTPKLVATITRSKIEASGVISYPMIESGSSMRANTIKSFIIFLPATALAMRTISGAIKSDTISSF